MAHSLTLNLPDDVYQPLLRKAQQAGRTPEDIIAECLADAVGRLATDPLLELAGAFSADVRDAGERHDEYLGEALMKDHREETSG